jgi:hypothetical protein
MEVRGDRVCTVRARNTGNVVNFKSKIITVTLYWGGDKIGGSETGAAVQAGSSEGP